MNTSNKIQMMTQSTDLKKTVTDLSRYVPEVANALSRAAKKISYHIAFTTETLCILQECLSIGFYLFLTDHLRSKVERDDRISRTMYKDYCEHFIRHKCNLSEIINLEIHDHGERSEIFDINTCVESLTWKMENTIDHLADVWYSRLRLTGLSDQISHVESPIREGSYVVYADLCVHFFVDRDLNGAWKYSQACNSLFNVVKEPFTKESVHL